MTTSGDRRRWWLGAGLIGLVLALSSAGVQARPACGATGATPLTAILGLKGEALPAGREVEVQALVSGRFPGDSGLSEVEHCLSPTPDVEGIAEGDIIELIAGPFQGEKARVQRIDEGKDQVTVELYEATVPIPVPVRGDQIRVLDSEER